jgi:Tol biopolymer transport system component
MGHRCHMIAELVVSTTLLTLALAVPVLAAFPGQNGRIAFTSVADGNAEIYSIKADGSDPVNLTNNLAAEREPAWSPDGHKIAFVSDREGVPAIYVMNADGSNQTRLTSGTEEERNPVWSPDGTRIAFGRGGFFSRRLLVMEADGSREVTLGSGGNPSWSPDGTKLAFDTAGFDAGEIWAANADGTSLANLSNNGQLADDARPDWSPNGDLIAYQSRAFYAARESRIFTLSPDGGTPKPRTVGDDIQVEWSPDEAKLAFSHIPALNTAYDYDIHVTRLDGSGEYALTDFGDGDEFFPTWSPAGDKIAFIVSHGAFPYELYVIDSDGGDPVKLSGSSQSVFDWQAVQNRDPDCDSVRADPTQSWPPNRAFTPVALRGATDPDGDQVTMVIDSVSQDEPVVGSGDATSPDAVLASGSELRLRAERNPSGDGRVYRIAFTASDGKGGTCSGRVSVSVSRHMKISAVDSAPPSFDSLAS